MNHLLFYLKENQTAPTYSSLISSFFFLSNFQIPKNFICLFSGTERPAKLKLGPHMDSRLMYHVYFNQAAGAYLFLYLFKFLCLKFQNIFFVTLFCEAYKVETWYTHGQWVDLLCAPSTSSRNVLVPLVMSPPPFGVRRHIVFAQVVCPSVCPSQNHVRSVTQKPFEIFSWNYTNVKQHETTCRAQEL